uniref:Uncharacterized protein n=1 Tax=Arundo donax TaxID=35708 RepID=A0A0A9C486_ARUDO
MSQKASSESARRSATNSTRIGADQPSACYDRGRGCHAPWRSGYRCGRHR